MTTADIIIKEMTSLYDEGQSKHLARFFKTGKGNYGEGDKFLGIKVPTSREIVKKYRTNTDIKDIVQLIGSEWHEIRLVGFLLLVELYNKAVKSKNWEVAKNLSDFYIANLDKGNNWDLVDLVAPFIIGDRVRRNKEDSVILLELADKEESLWCQRVAIVATFALIKTGEFDLTFQIAEKYLDHKHDLIHKATGWMLRETGKRGGMRELTAFLEKHKSEMPRTMLRYAIEKFPEDEKRYFMDKK